GKLGERRQTSRHCRFWRKERAKHFESNGRVQAFDRTLPSKYGRSGSGSVAGAHRKGRQDGGERDAGGFAAARTRNRRRPGFASDAGGRAHFSKTCGRSSGAYSDLPRHRPEAGARRKQGKFHATRWAAGGRAAAEKRKLWRGSALFHRFERALCTAARTCQRHWLDDKRIPAGDAEG